VLEDVKLRAGKLSLARRDGLRPGLVMPPAQPKRGRSDLAQPLKALIIAQSARAGKLAWPPHMVIDLGAQPSYALLIRLRQGADTADVAGIEDLARLGVAFVSVVAPALTIV